MNKYSREKIEEKIIKAYDYKLSPEIACVLADLLATSKNNQSSKRSNSCQAQITIPIISPKECDCYCHEIGTKLNPCAICDCSKPQEELEVEEMDFDNANFYSTQDLVKHINHLIKAHNALVKEVRG